MPRWCVRGAARCVVRSLICVVVLAGCTKDEPAAPADAGVRVDGEVGPYAPDRYCPGAAACTGEGDRVLYVGVGKREITAEIGPTTDVQTVDVDGDGEFNPEDGDDFEDRNSNGRFDGAWIAGFGYARSARGVSDPQWARAIVLRYGETSIALVSLDVIGLFGDEINQVRTMVADLGIDFIAVSSTHTHEARDTVGIWGISEDVTGLDPAYMEMLRTRTAEAIRLAAADTRASHVQYASIRLKDQPGGMLRYVSDVRDPNVIDDEIRVMRFTEASGGATITTLVNWGSHPGYADDRNTLLSSDYPHWLRLGVEEGVMGPDGPLAGVGGTCVFFQGALGVQIGPDDFRPAQWDGTPVTELNLETSALVGRQIAAFVLKALGPTGGSTTEETAPLGFRSRTFMLDVQNRGYHIAFIQGLFDREGYNWDPGRPLIPGVNEPDIRTEIAIVDIGRAQILMLPGELDPMLFVGGLDGSYTPAGQMVVDGSRTNPPDLSRAPTGPYLRDQARDDASMVLFFGLANDYLGYFVPTFDYELHPTNPYLDEAPGDHYEETNSLGIDAWPRIENEIQQLLAWRP